MFTSFKEEFASKRWKKRTKPSALAVIKAMNIASLAAIGAIPGPRAPATSLYTDWEAISGDVKAAIADYASRRAA